MGDLCDDEYKRGVPQKTKKPKYETGKEGESVYTPEQYEEEGTYTVEGQEGTFSETFTFSEEYEDSVHFNHTTSSGSTSEE
jgi:hypothetical protein